MLGVLEEVFLPLDEVRRRPATQASFHAYDLFKDRAPLLDPVRDRRQTPDAQRAAFRKAELAVKGLLNLWDVKEPNGKTGGPAITDLLTFASETGLLDLHPGLPDALASEPPIEPDEASTADEPTPDEDKTPTAALAEALRQPWSAYRSYLHYVAGLGTHATHQGVKGSEFDRVLVVIDDKAAGGNLFAYEKIFGAVPLSKNDLTNEKEGKETGIDRTLRLLYVTCSRAAGSLALVFWTSSPDAVQKRAMDLGWFDAKEISEVPEPEAPQATSSFASP
ncbi:MAG TPA: hypothetical protein PKW90_22665, partial [Myxococcota bacterium]|nr:hypothetical protein [Myxococcota bacterium]